MVSPVVLKRRHTLVDRNILPVIKNLRSFTGDTVPQYARVKSTLNTEDLPVKELVRYFRDLTAENEKEVLAMANRDYTEENVRLLLHFSIIHANEVGQPDGHELRPERHALDRELAELVEDETAQPTPSKKKKAAINSQNTNEVKVLRERVKFLCTQNDPNESLILLALDELSKKAISHQCEDAETLEELCRQSLRHQGKIDIATLALNVLGGGASDLVSKALSKCMKEKVAVKREKSSSPPPAPGSGAQSPLTNLYQPFPPGYNNGGFTGQPYYPYPYGQGQAVYGPAQGHFYGYGYRHHRPYRGRPSATSGTRQLGPCLFCDVMGHHIKDCEKLKAIKNK